MINQLKAFGNDLVLFVQYLRNGGDGNLTFFGDVVNGCGSFG